MRLSQYFFHTTKEAPHEAEVVSHQLFERAGYLRKLGRGLYTYTPLLWRVLAKLQTIVREEMVRAGAHEILMPLLHPAELWQKSGRYTDFKSANLLYTLNDRNGHEYCLAPTHEEIVVALASNWLTSYKQLPVNLFQIGTKFRDEIRPRFGLMRCKEFLMKDAYSFASSPEGMEKAYQAMHAAYMRIFRRCGLDFVVVEAHGGKIGKGKSEEFQVKAAIGEDLILVCKDYACNVEAAQAIPRSYSYEKELKAKELTSTPDVATIESLAAFLKVRPEEILKTIVYKLLFADRTEFVAIGIRGDRQVNAVKVATYLGAMEIELASEEEIEKLTGAKPGFIGPIDLKIPFYADKTAEPMTNFVVALNRDDYHYIHANYDRDFPRPTFVDFLTAEAGDGCPQVPGGTYEAVRGIEVGHVFNLGTLYSEKLGAAFQDEKGEMRPYWMGSYGIGIGRTAAACVEQSHDEKGIIWPMALTPFKISITASATNDPLLVAKADELYQKLEEAGFEPLYDDRDERLGVKLKDSDLIGLPYKLIIGKSYKEKGLLEIESRRAVKELIAEEQLLAWAKEKLS